jgi:hypothetical protein
VAARLAKPNSDLLGVGKAGSFRSNKTRCVSQSRVKDPRMERSASRCCLFRNSRFYILPTMNNTMIAPMTDKIRPAG